MHSKIEHSMKFSPIIRFVHLRNINWMKPEEQLKIGLSFAKVGAGRKRQNIREISAQPQFILGKRFQRIDVYHMIPTTTKLNSDMIESRPKSSLRSSNKKVAKTMSNSLTKGSSRKKNVA